MTLELKPPVSPMEAQSVDDVPVGEQWQYEPKWDGFRCLIFKNGQDVYLQSKSGQPLARYFPDVVDAVRNLCPKQFVLDSEIVIPVAGRASFDDLLLRIHPAASRVKKLADEHPAKVIVFDLLADARGRSLLDANLEDRRAKLEQFAGANFDGNEMIRLSPATKKLPKARQWFKAAGTDLDGIIAKRVDLTYRSGTRDGMQKIKHRRTADCVVGGFRYLQARKEIGSLLLGLYDSNGLLDHVGFTASFQADQRQAIAKVIEPHKGGVGFTGSAPGGPSRWNGGKPSEWIPLKPDLVVEVAYDHFTNQRFRHGTQFLRWRPDKKPKECTFEQLDFGKGTVLNLLRIQSPAARK